MGHTLTILIDLCDSAIRETEWRPLPVQPARCPSCGAQGISVIARDRRVHVCLVCGFRRLPKSSSR